MNMKITIEVEVADGRGCIMKNGYSCPWVLKGAGGQAWCWLFDQGRLKPEIEDVRVQGSIKCTKCLEACAKL